MSGPHNARATLPLNWIIVGGGITGIACAFALQRAGQFVTVLEKSDGKYRSPGCVSCPPNMTRILQSWGLGAELEAVSSRISQFTFVKGATGDFVGSTRFEEYLFEELGAYFYMLTHGDLHSLLLEAAINAGVRFEYNANVVSLNPDEATATLANGRVFKGDMILGADGTSSMVRGIVVDDDGEMSRGIPTDYAVFMATMSSTEMAEVMDLEGLATTPGEIKIWMGPDTSIFGVLVKEGGDYTMNLYLPMNGERFEESWNTQYDKHKLEERLGCYEPKVQKCFSLAHSVIVTQHVLHPMPYDYTCMSESGKVIIVGEAVHSLPNGSMNCALGIEDACVLGAMFSHLRTPSQIPILLASYEELREKRCVDTVRADPYLRSFSGLPDGEEQEMRDEAFAAASKASLEDDEMLGASLENYLREFAWNSEEVVEEWWTKWGSYMNAMVEDTPQAGKSLDLGVVRSELMAH